MTIALRGTVQGASSNPTVSHSAISGISVGDLYLDLAQNTGGGAAPTFNGSYPFTTIGTGTAWASANYTFGYRYATGAESALAATGSRLTDIFLALQGIDVATPVESFQSAVPGPTTTAVCPASTPTTDNCWHVVLFSNTNDGTNTITTPPSGYTLLGSTSNGTNGSLYTYYKDLGAGSSGVSTGTASAVWSGAMGGLAAGFIVRAGGGGPTVTTVSNSSATEGSSIAHTVTLSTAVTGSAASYAISIGGGTATGGGTDYTSTLTNGMFSNGVTVSGGNISVPVGVSTFTVTIPTASDTIDEGVSETYTLTIGGTSGTGTITDDDAAPTITGTASSTVTAGDPVVITYSPGLSGQTRTYTLALTDGTAVGGTDYDNTTVTGDFAVTAGTGSVSISGSTVTVDPGVTEFTLTITTTA